MAFRHVLLWLSVLLLIGLAGCTALPDEAQTKVINLTEAEIAFSTSHTPPQSGWRKITLPQWSLEEESRARLNGQSSVWVRFQFDGSAVGSGPHALYTEDVAERYVAWLNGANVHRTYAGQDDWVIGWNRPALAALPNGAIKPGANELVLRVDTGLNWFLSVGYVKVGSLEVLRNHFRIRHFWRIDGPRAADVSLLGLTLFTFVLWLARRKHEPELIWLVGIGLLYYIRGGIFYYERAPFQPELYGASIQALLFFLPPVAFGFYAEFLKIPNRARWNILYFSLGALLAILSTLLAINGDEGRECTWAMLTMAVISTGMAFNAQSNADQVERITMLTVISATIAAGIHDTGRQDTYQWWDGPGFFVQPFNGIAIFTAFFVLIGRRFLKALTGFETLNAELEHRVEQATAALSTSEAARHKLEVERALEGERGRLMREVHDGIGSNLVTALAMAQRERLPDSTIGVLRRAVADLKITVDSLDPLEGDVLALLGNLRHRLEPDLVRAGVETHWQVLDCPSLPWLDPANALQFLRLMQEAISNALSHSGADLITFACAPSDRNGEPGIQIIISDNGCGFDGAGSASLGKGLSNMHVRADALAGAFDVQTRVGQGTRVSLWLPLDQKSEPA